MLEFLNPKWIKGGIYPCPPGMVALLNCPSICVLCTKYTLCIHCALHRRGAWPITELVCLFPRRPIQSHCANCPLNYCSSHESSQLLHWSVHETRNTSVRLTLVDLMSGNRAMFTEKYVG